MAEEFLALILTGFCIWIIYRSVKWLCWNKRNADKAEDDDIGRIESDIHYWNKRNPDKAEEDDIGPIEPDIRLESSFQTRGPLLMELRRYYHNQAAIPVHRRKRAIEVVESIKCYLQRFVKNDWTTNYSFGNILPQGSGYEGLQVIEPDEFDLLLPLMLKNSNWNYSKYQSSGYVFITKIQNYVFNTKTPYDNAIVSDVYLSPISIKRKMQSIVKRAVDKMDFLNVERITLRESGPALTLEVRYDGSQRMSIDIVPSIKLENKLFVAKRHPESDQYQCRTDLNIFNNLWRVSFSEEEKAIIRKMDGKNECRRTCLKILKTIRVRMASSPLNGLSSYHLKTCLLHLNAYSIWSWHQDNLDNRFKDLLMKLIQFLEDEKMPSFFDPNIDLFSTNNTFQLQNIRRWLERIIKSDDKIIDEMLHY